MARFLAWFTYAALLLTSCTHPAEPSEIILALPPDGSQPAASGVRLLRTSDPLGALNSGQASLAIMPGPVPAGFEGSPLSAGEVVLVQGWLDRPLSLTRAEAEDKARDLPLASQATAKPGALARARLKDLKPGWRAIPVDGVPPTPETVWSGRYPLSNLTSVVYRSDADDRARAAAEGMRAAAAKRLDQAVCGR